MFMVYSRVLNSVLSKAVNSTSSNVGDPRGHANYHYLRTPQKEACLKQRCTQAKIHQLHIKRRKDLLESAIEQRGIEVDDSLHDDLHITMEESSSDVASGFFPTHLLEAAAASSSSEKLKVYEVGACNDKVSINCTRSVPLIGCECIWWCLYLRHLSSSAYETLRKTGVLSLPSQRTLQDYTYYTEAPPGFSLGVDQQLMDAANINSCPEREKQVILLLDEMHIKENLVYDKHTGTLRTMCIYSLWLILTDMQEVLLGSQILVTSTTI